MATATKTPLTQAQALTEAIAQPGLSPEARETLQHVLDKLAEKAAKAKEKAKEQGYTASDATVQMRKDVLAVLQAAGEPMTASEVAAKLTEDTGTEVKVQRAASALKYLVEKAGTVEIVPTEKVSAPKQYQAVAADED